MAKKTPNTNNAPKMSTLCVACILAVVGVIGKFVSIPVVSQYAFFILLVAFVVLLLGCLLKGL